MRKIKIANTDLCVPQIALGCMRINSKSREEAKRFVDTALELGLNFLIMPTYTEKENVKKSLPM